jgi:hypothetical protein
MKFTENGVDKLANKALLNVGVCPPLQYAYKSALLPSYGQL